jgi:2-methylcitrate dehydratase PrpD
VITGPVGLAIKPYPSCGFTHTAIDCALNLREQGVKSEEIVVVELGTSPFDKQLLIHHRPRTGLEGKFSLEYCVAHALVSGGVRLDSFAEKAILEPEVQRLIEGMKWMEKYPMPVMGTPEGFGAKSVTVTTRNGRKYSAEARVAKGMPTNPLSVGELNAKYRDCASTVLSEKAVDESLSLLTGMQKVRTVAEIMMRISGG